ARAIAREISLPEDCIQGIWVASLIHDIGKIRVPSDILSKPGRITKAEFELIKEHPQTGYEVLSKIDFPWPVAEIVLQHHERMDGSGYPQGLKGDEILLASRIIGVADVVEAMTYHRPYREALGLDAALEEIKKNKGILYDPEVVDACIMIFLEKRFKLTGFPFGTIM
ncbi:MAG: HD-GYP domain-containing protein, partial [Dethiobacteria bacterium]